MNLEILSAQIAARIPEMARDSAANNAEIIKGMLRDEMAREKTSPPPAEIAGRLVEIGDDDSGCPRLFVLSTRAAIMACGRNLLFSNVVVRGVSENVTSGR